MSINLYDSNLSFTKTTFPGGESCIRVAAPHPAGFDPEITIVLDFESNADLFDLSLLVDAVRRMYTENGRLAPKLKLMLGYVPYARQDRVCNPGESLSIKVVADFINSLDFTAVCVIDPHSDVTTAVLNNVVVIPQEAAAKAVAKVVDVENTIIVAPDAGASKKASKFANAGGFHAVIQAEKVRDLPTGKILETRVPDILVGNMDFLIVDDICDGGRTFTELAKVLRPKTTGKIMLFVTHGIFSAGEKVFDDLIDNIYTANAVGATGKAAVDSGRIVLL